MHLIFGRLHGAGFMSRSLSLLQFAWSRSLRWELMMVLNPAVCH
jgi:hypothetical protein